MAITHMAEPHPDEATYGCLHPIVREWFTGTFTKLSPPQQYSILNIHSGVNTLISSPTGSGKTLSAFLAIINRLVLLEEEGRLEKKVYCVYVSPLKALANDITRNLKEPLKEIQELARKRGKRCDIRVGTRTGDTTASQRAAMLRTPPHILITTPESLAIALTTTKFREMLRPAEFVIIDEIHAVAESKRGVHLALSLERFEELVREHDVTKGLIRIGLSATVSPLEEVAQFLVGLEDPDADVYRPCSIVDVQHLKRMDLKVLCPVSDIMRASHDKLQAALYEMLHDLIRQHKTTLVFTNTRSATERVVHQLKSRYPKDYASLLDGETEQTMIERETEAELGMDAVSGAEEPSSEESSEPRSEPLKASRLGLIGAHHGSLSKTHRLTIESRLKEGKLKAVVCSTSLELGIDIGSIDLVILLGSPKSVARAMQRIGRSGHQLEEKAKGRIIVLDRDDMLECSILLKAAIEKRIDRIHIPYNALDVLAQQLFGLAIEKVRTADELYRIVRQCHCYHRLPRGDFNQVISYLAGEYVTLEKRSVYAKIWHDKESGNVGRRGKLARLIYLTNVGTIPDETNVLVKIGEEAIGTIDEGFLERLSPGDVFVLGGETYEFRFSRGLTAQVRSVVGRPPTVPNWVSEMLPLSYDLAVQIQVFRQYIEEMFRDGRSKEEIIAYMDGYLYVDERTLTSLYGYFREQYRFAEVPHRERLLVEHYREGNNRIVIAHTLYGRRVNDVLSRALAFALGRLHHRDVAVAITDNGFSLRSSAILNVRKAFSLLKSDELERVMRKTLEKSEVLGRRFRHCAARSLMILRTYKGNAKSVGRQQMNSRLLIAAVKRISDDFPVLKEARREVLEDLMDIANAKEVLKQLENGRLAIKEIQTALPSPFAFNIVLQGYTDILKIEDRREFIKRMHELVLKRIDGPVETRKEKSGFTYESLWQEAEQRRARERDEEVETLKRQAWNLGRVPVWVKEAIVNVLDGVSPGERLEEVIRRHRDVILSEWPPGLASVVLTRCGVKFEPAALRASAERAMLLDQFRRGARKARLEPNLIAEGERLINGGEPNPDFWKFTDDLLRGSVAKAWQDDIVKFLRRSMQERVERVL